MWEDIALAVGTAIGIICKAIALRDNRTVWSRRSSGLNLITYPFTALLPFYSLGLWSTFFVTLISFFIWIGIFIWRAPDEENWLGLTYYPDFPTILSEDS